MVRIVVNMAAPCGLEPQHPDPESGVLPLDDRAIIIVIRLYRFEITLATEMINGKI